MEKNTKILLTTKLKYEFGKLYYIKKSPEGFIEVHEYEKAKIKSEERELEKRELIEKLAELRRLRKLNNSKKED